MSYTVYDLSESLARVDRFGKEDVAECVAAWGVQGVYNEWSGGFLLRLKDGRFAYLKGWCDTTGWGCQDGVQLVMHDEHPRLDPTHEWDLHPVDLNRFLRGEITSFDEPI